MGRVLVNSIRMCVCLLFADQRLRHVCVGLVLINNSHMGMCLPLADKQWTHGCAMVGS